MSVPLPLLGAVLAAFGIERAAEIALHRRHLRALLARGAIVTRDDGFGVILLAQVALFGGVALEATLAPWAAAGWWTWATLAAALLAQALRYWVVATLGERWTVRVVTLPATPRIVRGPYRWMRHPNYLAVAIESLALPLAFLSWATLAVALPLNLYALARRIRREDAALAVA